jgi:hypothetical protein
VEMAPPWSGNEARRELTETSDTRFSHLLKRADLPTLGRPTRMTVGRSAESTLVKSRRDCFMGFFLALPLCLVGAADSTAVVEYEKPVGKDSRRRGSDVRPAFGSWTV